MAPPKTIDFDKIARFVLADISSALDGWIKGQPTSEEALMNRVTEKLKKQRRNCNVGVGKVINVKSQLTMLHRKGANQTDLFGSDLAITIFIEDTNLLKTAFFQFKTGNNFKVSLEKKQLNQASARSDIYQRSFVIFVDKENLGIRIKPVPKIIGTFNNKQNTKTFNTLNWNFLIQWLWNWLSCSTGPSSDRNDPNSIESLLQHYIPEGEKWDSVWPISRDVDFADFIPARTWLVVFLTESNPNPGLGAIQERLVE
jgi:hypothetical protein